MSSTLQRVRFTTTEYTRMASILEGRRTELIDGEIIEMAPIGTAHLLVVSRLQHHLEQGMADPGVRVLVQQPLIVDQFDEPQPDLVVLREALESRKPRVADCLVVIEVSDSTYATDVGIKLPAYLPVGRRAGSLDRQHLRPRQPRGRGVDARSSPAGARQGGRQRRRPGDSRQRDLRPTG
jgi:Uma2 family endonuclease